MLVRIGFHFFANLPWNGLQVRSCNVVPFGMHLNKSVNNGSGGSVLADWLIDGDGALFVCELDLNLFHLISIRLRDLNQACLNRGLNGLKDYADKSICEC